MRMEDFSRQASKVHCTCMGKACLFCTLMMLCVYAHNYHCSWCVCVCLHRHRAAASVLEHVLILFLQFWHGFCLRYCLKPCRAVLAWFEHSSVAFTLVFRSVLC